MTSIFLILFLLLFLLPLLCFITAEKHNIQIYFPPAYAMAYRLSFCDFQQDNQVTYSKGYSQFLITNDHEYLKDIH